MNRTFFVRRPGPPDGRHSDHLGLVPAEYRRRTSLLLIHPLRAPAQTLFRFELLRSCPLRLKTSPPSCSTLSHAKASSGPPPPAHAVPIPAPPRWPPGSPVRMCSGRFSWVAASNARVAPPPPPPSHRVSGNCLSGVGCGVPYRGLTHDDLAGGEVADAEGSPRVVSVDAEYDALGPAWRQLMLRFESPQVSDGSKRKEVIERGPIPTQSSYGETPRLRGIIVQRFYISLV